MTLSRLHLLHVRRRDRGDEERVLARVLARPAPVGLADRVAARPEQHLMAGGARLLDHRLGVRARGGRVPRRPERAAGRQRGGRVVRALGLPAARRDARARVRHPQLGDAEPLDRAVVERGRRLALVARHQLDLLLERHRREQQRGPLIGRQARVHPRAVRVLGDGVAGGHRDREGGGRRGERDAPAEDPPGRRLRSGLQARCDRAVMPLMASSPGIGLAGRVAASGTKLPRCRPADPGDTASVRLEQPPFRSPRRPRG